MRRYHLKAFSVLKCLISGYRNNYITYLKYIHHTGIKLVLKNLANIIITLIFTAPPPPAICWVWFSQVQLLILPKAIWNSVIMLLLIPPKIPFHKRNRVFDGFFRAIRVSLSLKGLRRKFTVQIL